MAEKDDKNSGTGFNVALNEHWTGPTGTASGAQGVYPYLVGDTGEQLEELGTVQ